MYQTAITARARSFQAEDGIEPSSNDSTNSHNSKVEGNSAFKSDMVSPFVLLVVGDAASPMLNGASPIIYAIIRSSRTRRAITRRYLLRISAWMDATSGARSK